MDLGDDDFDVILVAFLELVQVRLVQEEVAVHPFLVGLHRRLYVVGEHFDLQVDILLGQNRLDEFQDFRVWDRCRSDHQFVGGWR